MVFTTSLFASGEVDTAINQTVWKMLYSVTAAQSGDTNWWNADSDGDGVSNDGEAAAGTDPFNAKSTIAVTSVTSDETSIFLTFATAAGKNYVVQSRASLDSSGSWQAVSPLTAVMGDGTIKTLTVPKTGAQIFYRVAVQDVDSDGDEVSDWAEIAIGFDATTAHTEGAAADDHTAILSELAEENVVTITAIESSATQPEAGGTATDTGVIKLSRAGTLHFSAITVPLIKSGTALEGVDYSFLPASVTLAKGVGSTTITIKPLANTSRTASVTATVKAGVGGGYSIGAPAGGSVVIRPAAVPSGTGLTGAYYNSTSAAIGTAPFASPSTLVLTRLDPVIDFLWSGASPGTGVNATYFTTRWTGQVQPQYSETYYFVAKADDGVRLWVNGQQILNSWTYVSGDRTGSISLQGGVRYDIVLEYYNYSGGSEAHLSWYSESQVKQIIPTARLYPSSATSTPGDIVSAASAVGFVGQPFSFVVKATSAATFSLGVNSEPLPPGLTLDASTGVISGTPSAVGDYQVTLTAVNAGGTGSSVLQIQILNPGNKVTRELWYGLSGGNVADIPVNTSTSVPYDEITAVEDTAEYGDNTGERLRGYFTPPTTGNYYFWIAASNAAELWISNDAEPVNKVRRAWVAAPGVGDKTWSAQTSQKSPWLSLVAGQKYYYEILHNTGAANPDHVSAGWLLDPTGSSSPIADGAGVVPGYILWPYDFPAVVEQPGTLYATNMAPQGTSKASGSASLRLNADNTQAILHFQYGSLSAARTGYSIQTEPWNGNPSQLIYDIDVIESFRPDQRTSDGGFIWAIKATGTLSATDIVQMIREGRVYIIIQSADYPAGELKGNFGRVEGSQNAPTPVLDPGYPDDHTTDAGAARFLNQATFGPSPQDLAAVKSDGFSAWIDNQFAIATTRSLPEVYANYSLNPTNVRPSSIMLNTWWKQSVTGSDQLRQRLAFALSEIFVVSDRHSSLAGNAQCLAAYYDVLKDQAFGNFREILEQVTLTPAMGFYLDMRGNAKGNLTTGKHPSENYAREILQLFSTGLNRMWPDGTMILDSNGDLIPTYNQDVILGFSRVFTGWTYNQALQASGRLPTGFSPSANYVDPMVLVPTQHELGSKLVLDNVVLPAATGYTIGVTPPADSQAASGTEAFDTYCLQDLEKALDNIFNNTNTGPYICRQLIQRLVTSTPSASYLGRVVAKFNDDGTAQHTRGNMQAVIRAILLDGEARDTPSALASATFGKQREPVLRITGPARTFPSAGTSGTYAQSGTSAITVTTSTPHKLSSNDRILLDFTSNAVGTPAVEPETNPTTGSYTVSVPTGSANTFTFTAPNLLSYGYAQAASSSQVTLTTTGIAVDTKMYLKFTSGNAPEGIYTVTGQPDATHLTLTKDDGGISATATTSGNVVIPRISAGAVVTNSSPAGTAIFKVVTYGNHNLPASAVGGKVWQAATGQRLLPGEYTIDSLEDGKHFTINVPNSDGVIKTGNDGGLQFYVLAAPQLVRSGNVTFGVSKFDAGNTNGSIVQSPLNAPTVFNFFYPDYRYPGVLAAANLTTPEFQLTTDSNIVTLTNSVSSSILSSGNTNGLASFAGGTGSITMDLSPYMISSIAGTTGSSGDPATEAVRNLTNQMSDLLTGGAVTSQTKDIIVGFVANNTNFPPTSANNVRDRVRAVVQLILASPEYAIQK